MPVFIPIYPHLIASSVDSVSPYSLNFYIIYLFMFIWILSSFIKK